MSLGVGRNLSGKNDYDPPVRVRVVLPPLDIDQQLQFNPPGTPASGVLWQRVSFRLVIPGAYKIPGTNFDIVIQGLQPQRFVGVDHVSVRELVMAGS
jgi:hypothetical protein